MSKGLKMVIGLIVAVAFNIIAQTVMEEKQVLGWIVGLITYFEITR